MVSFREAYKLVRKALKEQRLKVFCIRTVVFLRAEMQAAIQSNHLGRRRKRGQIDGKNVVVSSSSRLHPEQWERIQGTLRISKWLQKMNCCSIRQVQRFSQSDPTRSLRTDDVGCNTSVSRRSRVSLLYMYYNALDLAYSELTRNDFWRAAYQTQAHTSLHRFVRRAL